MIDVAVGRAVLVYAVDDILMYYIMEPVKLERKVSFEELHGYLKGRKSFSDSFYSVCLSLPPSVSHYFSSLSLSTYMHLFHLYCVLCAHKTTFKKKNI